MGFFHFAWSRTLVCAVLFQYNSIRKVLVRLGERPLTVRVSRERALKIPYGICPFLLRSKNVSNLRLFQHFSALPLSDLGGEVVIKVTLLVL